MNFRISFIQISFIVIESEVQWDWIQPRLLKGMQPSSCAPLAYLLEAIQFKVYFLKGINFLWMHLNCSVSNFDRCLSFGTMAVFSNISLRWMICVGFTYLTKGLKWCDASWGVASYTDQIRNKHRSTDPEVLSEENA